MSDPDSSLQALAKRPRKVLLVASWYPTPRRPIEGVFIQDQVRVLAGTYDVAVIAPDLRTGLDLVRYGPGAARTEAMEDPGIPVIRPRVISPIPRRPVAVVEHYTRAVLHAYEWLSRTWGRPDLIHAHVVLNGGYAAAALGRRLGVPVVLTEHASRGSTFLKPLLRPTLIRETLESMAVTIAVSPSLADRIREIAPVEVRVIGNVIDTDFFVPELSPRDPGSTRFATLARLIEPKGLDVLLEAARILVADGQTDWAVKVAGGGPLHRSLQASINRFGLQPFVQLIGPIDRAAVRELYQWADFAVLPSRYETFGLAAGEAMAMGRPVIGTRTGGFEWVIGNTGGILVPINDPIALAEAMSRAAAGLGGFDRRVIRASIVERFSPEVFLHKITDAYSDALRVN